MIHLYIINALNSNEKQSRKQCIDFTLCNVYENNAISTVMIYSVSFLVDQSFCHMFMFE